MLVCIWPTPGGGCLTTSSELESSRGDLVAIQEHLRDEHLGPDYQWDMNYSRFTDMLQGTREDLPGNSYVYKLANGQQWLWSGTEDQFAEWFVAHDAELTGEGDTTVKAMNKDYVDAMNAPEPYEADGLTARPVRPQQATTRDTAATTP